VTHLANSRRHTPHSAQAGILNNKGLTNRAQKASLYGWFGGSLCTIVLELYELAGGWKESNKGGEGAEGADGAQWHRAAPAAAAGPLVCCLSPPAHPCMLRVLRAAAATQRAGESVEEYQARLDKARPDINRRLIALIHACFQVGASTRGSFCCLGRQHCRLCLASRLLR
jgi:hypothetical protein